MTKTQLKKLIRHVILESRIRSSPMGYNAAIRAAADKLKQKMADVDVVKTADDAAEKDFVPRSSVSRAVNITARIQELSRRIEELESQVPKRSDETEADYYVRVVDVLREKTQMEIDRLEYVLEFERNAAK